MAAGKVLPEEATRGCSTQALNHSRFGTGHLQLLFHEPGKTLKADVSLAVFYYF